MKNIFPIALVTASLALTSCKTMFDKSSGDEVVVELDTLEVVDEMVKRPVYRASNTRKADLIHTKLNVKFDWENQYLNGKANLILKPYFYALSELDIDAKGFDIHKVTLVGEQEKELDYEYDNSQLHISLDKTYTRQDTFEIYIEYTAKPEEREEGGSAAIMSDKGLYFIDPLEKDETKPEQIWTQGETEASSGWFPTIDSPNERMTQELAITVQNKYNTLSNGTLQFSTENEDGTRTDYWAQEKPHAPYLVMMAVGDFAVVNDTWRDSMAVDYYVEHEYEDDAMAIFGETPEMIEFFSTVLDYPYPWDKYSQIVVRDYVSGAMENTSAVIHGEFLQRTKQELIDGDNEDIIAHELFHHWFGDLVTCESWSNLPLNESFATYGEYLWNEYKHGRMAADYTGYNDLQQYLAEFGTGKHVDLIRFDYDNQEDMFDGHSYQKGGRVLHMLRKYVGDEAFFASLSKYLKDNQYQSVEIHNLRLAFEAVTGEDLNWFFNQWFLSSGHPDLLITYSYDETAQEQKVTIEQKQDKEEFPLYKLPIDVDIYTTNGVERHRIVLDSLKETFSFDVAEKPTLVNVDAEKMLLGTKTDSKSTQEYLYQLKNAPLFLDKLEAMKALDKVMLNDSTAASAMFGMLTADFEQLQLVALGSSRKMKKYFESELETILTDLVKTAEQSSVRAKALDKLTELYEADSYKDLLVQKMTTDSSLLVIGQALSSLSQVDEEMALKYARDFEKDASGSVLMTISSLYAKLGDNKDGEFFVNNMSKASGFSKMAFVSNYAAYLNKDGRDLKAVEAAIPVFEKEITADGMWYINYVCAQSFMKVKNNYNSKVVTLEKEVTKAENDGNQSEAQIKQDELIRLKGFLSKMDESVARLKANENINDRVKAVF
tara:strand:+ start:2889 stop:5546 length:2658 start_codon:yes stop_codon:yes gene_type:complete